MNCPSQKSRHPLLWVPNLYIANQLPFAVMTIIVIVMYKGIGISNQDIVYWTGLFGLAWTFNALWSPLLELASRKKIVVLTQLIAGLGLLITAFIVKMPGLFLPSAGLLILVSLASATHSTAADGAYIESLTQYRRAVFIGWVDLFSGIGKTIVHASMVVGTWLLHDVFAPGATAMAVCGGLLIALSGYHAWAMPTAETRSRSVESSQSAVPMLKNVITTFFGKPGIWLAITFVMLLEMNIVQVLSLAREFMMEDVASGGLSLSMKELALLSGVFTTASLTVGGILGGYLAIRRGIKSALRAAILLMNLPCFLFWLLNAFPESELFLVAGVLVIGAFGCGLGFSAIALFVMESIARGPYPTAHYAFGAGLMQLAIALSHLAGTYTQNQFGYSGFFVFVMLLAIAATVAWFKIKFDSDANLAELCRGPHS